MTNNTSNPTPPNNEGISGSKETDNQHDQDSDGGSGESATDTSRIRAPGSDSELIEECEVCGGYLDAGAPGHRKSPDERFVHEFCYQNGESPDDYVLDLTDDAAGRACVNRQYNCGHIAYGPRRDLLVECPQCQEHGLSAMDSDTRLVTDGGFTNQCVDCGEVRETFHHYESYRCPDCIDNEQQLVTDGGKDEPAWAVWCTDGRRDECVAVSADNEEAARERALAESEFDGVQSVDGPFPDCEPAVYTYEYLTEHRETITVEAPYEDYAREAADLKRDHRGEYVQTVHVNRSERPKRPVATDGGTQQAEIRATNPQTAILDAIDDHFDDDRCGAPVGDVIEAVLTDPTISLDDAAMALRDLCVLGRVYQPSDRTVARISTDGGEEMQRDPPADRFEGRSEFDRKVSELPGGKPDRPSERIQRQTRESEETSVRVDLETLDDVDDILTALAADDDVHPPTEVEFHQRGSVSLHWEVQDR